MRCDEQPARVLRSKSTMKMNSSTLFCALAIAIAAAGCSRSSAATAPAASSSAAASTVKPAGTIAKVVFVGEEHGCPCRQGRIDAGWAALQEALGTPPKLPFEKIFVDTQGPKVQVYTQQKPILTMPGIFLVDASNKVIDLLQGDITRAQIDASIAAVQKK
jgi:hypothetical protein